MKTVIMFPGQGSQYLGMGRDFYETEPIYQQSIDKASELLGFNLSHLMLNGPDSELIKTENTQPALVAMSLGVLEVLKRKENFSFQAVIGHSLGEYSAYAASGRLSFEDAIRLTRTRGLLMSQAGNAKKYGMAAILKLGEEQLRGVLKPYQLKIDIANFNAPGQIVISGIKESIEEVLHLVKNIGGRGIVLPVGGAFHSQFMKPVALQFKEYLMKVDFQGSEIPLYSNISADLLKPGEEVDSLERQLYSSVLFTQSIENMVKKGYQRFIEIGAGKVLQGLVKKIHHDLTIFGVEKIEDLSSIRG